jgi:vibriolysin
MARVPRIRVPLSLFAAAGLALWAACGDASVITNFHVPEDVDDALTALPRVESVETGAGDIPYFVKGDLGRSGKVSDLASASAQLASTVAQIAPVFRLRAAELAPVSLQKDAFGTTHVKYMQTRDGLEVVGGDLIVHLGDDGIVRAVTSSARGDYQLSGTPGVQAETARSLSRGATVGKQLAADEARLVYVVSGKDGQLHLAWETRVTGVDGEGTPIIDLVYVDAHAGIEVDRHPLVHTARNRSVYNLNKGTSLPGSLARSEGSSASSDTDVNAAYDNTGTTYDVYKELFNRDSYDNSGATLKSSVHYSTNYVNAYWNGSQMVYGDGDNVNSIPLARALDVTAHELTHAVTERTSGLNYSNESGALNEGWSDIFAAVVEWDKDGKVVSDDTWKVGEDIWTPGTQGDALRYMNDPAKDGSSSDYYPTRYQGSQDNGGVHWNSGIANLAFKLAVTGGTHPRGKTSITVPALGMAKAAQIFYLAGTQYMTSTTNFAGARTACATAATKVDAANAAADKYAVEAAWYAVGVGSAPTPPGGTDPGNPPTNPGTIVLTSGTAVSVPSLAKNANQQYSIVVPAGASSLVIAQSGGTGDADLYEKFGSAPTTSSYDQRPYLNGNAETITINNPAAGTYYIMVNAYAASSGVTLKATVNGGTTPPPANALQNGVPVTGLSGATGSTSTTYTFTVPAGVTTATIKISGGSGDADVYVKAGAAPTTSVYDYRPWIDGNAETVTVASAGGKTWYVNLNAYAAYSGVTLVASY